MTLTDFRIRQTTAFGAPHEQIEMLNPYGAVPKDMRNSRYRKYLSWVATGYTAQIIDEDGGEISPAIYTPPQATSIPQGGI